MITGYIDSDYCMGKISEEEAMMFYHLDKQTLKKSVTFYIKHGSYYMEDGMFKKIGGFKSESESEEEDQEEDDDDDDDEWPDDDDEDEENDE